MLKLLEGFDPGARLAVRATCTSRSRPEAGLEDRARLRGSGLVDVPVRADLEALRRRAQEAHRPGTRRATPSPPRARGASEPTPSEGRDTITLASADAQRWCRWIQSNYRGIRHGRPTSASVFQTAASFDHRAREHLAPAPVPLIILASSPRARAPARLDGRDSSPRARCRSCRPDRLRLQPAGSRRRPARRPRGLLRTHGEPGEGGRRSLRSRAVSRPRCWPS